MRRPFTSQVFGSFLQPNFTLCPECGASVAVDDFEEHRCTPERRLDYQLFLLRDEIASFELQLATYLESVRGRFDLYYARRQRVSVRAA